MRLPFAQVVQRLLAYPTPLPGVVKANVVVPRLGPGHTGLRYFMKEYLPSLKYHNPNLVVEAKISKERFATGSVKLTMADGSEVNIDTHAKPTEAIFDAIMSAASSPSDAKR